MRMIESPPLERAGLTGGRRETNPAAAPPTSQHAHKRNLCRRHCQQPEQGEAARFGFTAGRARVFVVHPHTPTMSEEKLVTAQDTSDSQGERTQACTLNMCCNSLSRKNSGNRDG
jgi:hypothetical protein